MKQRTFEISQSSGMEVTKKEATCFIHQLARDASKPQSKRLYKWRRDTDAGVDAGPGAFCSEGLTEGSLIKLCTITENGKPGVQFAFFKHGDLWYMCKEFGGHSANDMHLACLHAMVAKVVLSTQPQVTPVSAPLSEIMDAVKPQSEPKEPTTKVGDVFRQITADRLVEYLFEESGPNRLTIGIVKGSPAWTQRENLVRAAVTYLQNVPRKDTGILMVGFGLQRLKDHKVCGHLVTDSLSRVANAGVKFESSPYYAHLKPTEAVLKYAADIVINLLFGI